SVLCSMRSRDSSRPFGGSFPGLSALRRRFPACGTAMCGSRCTHCHPCLCVPLAR
ncbi:unnamed protein product, partial [Symbiodinium pilosum]